MTKSCFVRGCKSECYPGGGISFYGLPKDPDVCKAWQKVLGQETIPHWAAVCSKHFGDKDYIPRLSLVQPKKLKPDSVPARFMPFINRTPRPKVAVQKSALNDQEYSLVLQDSEELCDHEVDPLSTDSRPLLSVDRNIQNKQLLITIDATSPQNPPEDHNYTLKQEPDEVISDPEPELDPQNEQQPMADSDSQDEETDTHEEEDHTNNKTILSDLNKNTVEDYQRLKVMKESNRRKKRIDLLQRKVKLLQSRLRRCKERQEKMKIIEKTVNNYTKFSEIDNILSGRFKELCKTVPITPKKLDYTSDVIKFAISLYYLSPKAYNFVKKYMDLPHTKILQKYLASGTYIINLDE